MKQFTYNSKRVMPPRNGNKFATEYYKLQPAEFERVKQHISRVALAITEIEHHPEVKLWLHTPQKRFHKTTNDYYTPNEIVTDMLSQLVQGKDITKGLLGRWQRLFESVDSCNFGLTEEIVPTTNFAELFRTIKR